MAQAIATITIDGMVNSLGLTPKEFSTGNTGFFATTKLTDKDGTRYQTQIQMVKIKDKK